MEQKQGQDNDPVIYDPNIQVTWQPLTMEGAIKIIIRDRVKDTVQTGIYILQDGVYKLWKPVLQ